MSDKGVNNRYIRVQFQCRHSLPSLKVTNSAMPTRIPITTLPAITPITQKHSRRSLGDKRESNRTYSLSQLFPLRPQPYRRISALFAAPEGCLSSEIYTRASSSLQFPLSSGCLRSSNNGSISTYVLHVCTGTKVKVHETIIMRAGLSATFLHIS